jgi:glycosyltransferase involved in cell wall biosynthesis
MTAATDRLGVTLYSDAAYYGGAEVYLSTLARSLDPDRIRLNALVPDDPTVPRLEAELGDAGVTIHRHRRPGFSWWEALPRIRRQLAGIGDQVLHVNLPSTYDAGLSCVAAAARMAGYRRVVTTEHLPMIQRRYKRFPMKVLFSEAVDTIIVLAEGTRDDVIRRHHMPAEKTRLIPLGVEDPPQCAPEVEAALRAETDSPPGTLILGIVGRLSERKGHRILLEALSILRGQNRLPASLRLWVIGEGEDRGPIEEACVERGLGGIVHMIGPRDDAPSLMRLIDLLVVPSLMETTPFVILEAMAAGRPVIASRIYGIPEMVEEGESGFLIRPGDPADLARALGPLVVEEADLRSRFGRRARERFEARFAAKRMAHATEMAYRAIPPDPEVGR